MPGISISMDTQFALFCHENFGPKNFGPADQNFLGPSDNFFENFGPLANIVKIDLWCQLDAYR